MTSKNACARGHDWETTRWGVVVGVSRCLRCGRTATSEDVPAADFNLLGEGAERPGWERALERYREEGGEKPPGEGKGEGAEVLGRLFEARRRGEDGEAG